jgi:hypothetical protein
MLILVGRQMIYQQEAEDLKKGKSLYNAYALAGVARLSRHFRQV